MTNPPRPVEMKRKLGNPGKRAMPKEGSKVKIEGGCREPLRPLSARVGSDAVFAQIALGAKG